MPRNPSKTEIRNKATLDTWQNDLKDNAQLVTFVKWVQKNHPQVLAQFRDAKVKVDPLDEIAITDNFWNAAYSLHESEADLSIEMASRSKSKKLTIEELAKEIQILTHNEESTSLESVAEIFKVHKDTLKRFIKEEFEITDWRIYRQKVLEN